MAKSQKRTAERKQRHREPRQTETNIKKYSRGKKRNNTTLWFVTGIILTTIAVIVIFLLIKQQQAASVTQGKDSVISMLASMDQSVFDSVRSGSANNPMQPAKDAPVLRDPTGKPVFMYIGAEYCPHCAALRWSVIVALSRFGTFQSLEPVTSSEGGIPTFTFHHASYTSNYLHAILKETADNSHQPLDSLTQEEQQIFNQYNKRGSVPFIDVANQQISVGTYFPTELLIGRSYQDIVDQIKDPNSDICRGIIGAANYLVAAICAATGNQPENVCGVAPVPDMQKALPKALWDINSAPVTVAHVPETHFSRRIPNRKV